MPRQLGERGIAVDRVDIADQGRDRPDLAALDVADEVPGERSGHGRRLLGKVLRPVLTDDLDARLRKRRQLVGGHVLDRRQDLHLPCFTPRSGELGTDALKVGADAFGL
jgi:hypothetical protein